MSRTITATLFLLLIASPSLAGRLSAGLERQLATLAPGDEVTVLVVMKDRVDVTALDQQLHAAKAPLGHRHRVVLEALQDKASRTQEALLGDLVAKSNAGIVRDFTPHWLVNGVVVTTTADGARALAARDDVDVVEPDHKVELIAPAATAGTAAKAIGITPGVVAVGARRVWDELGIDGTGALVGSIDTGVLAKVAPLAGKWRGRTAPWTECWYDITNASTTPLDGDFHGTHTMGTILGRAVGDTIGVAPGAQFICANTLMAGTVEAFNSGMLATLEWLADPDGNPATTEDVPDVVNNSWGVSEDMELGYLDCDSRWWDAIDACEAAGIVMVWAAGNEGPGAGSLRSPADRATTAYNCFSIGSAGNDAPHAVSAFSSRGPSGCGGIYAVKPEIAGPGESVMSCVPDGRIIAMSGTSMAAPHVTGVVALMRSANPDVDVITIKQILMNTAVDSGFAGEDNATGYGFVDGYAAVLAVMADLGTVSGSVFNSVTGVPIAGSSVTVSAPGENPRTLITDPDGSFSTMLPVGTWTLETGYFGYAPGTATVVVVGGAVLIQDLPLAPLPSATLYGHVYDLAGVPVDSATVSALGTPVWVLTGAGGGYSLDLPVGGDYDVVAIGGGYAGDLHTLTGWSVDTELDFALPDIITEDFEGAGFLQLPWRHSGDAAWVIDPDHAETGTRSARSGLITHDQTSVLSLDVDVIVPGDLEFSFWTETEGGVIPVGDYLIFEVDGVEVARWYWLQGGFTAGNWPHWTHRLERGLHTLSWIYAKNGSVSWYSDAVWIDNLVFPTIAPPSYPAVAVDTAPLAVSVPPGGTTTRTLGVGNTGEAELAVEAVGMMSPAPGQAAAKALAKGEEDPAPGFVSPLGAGGPNLYGYTWIDSDDPAGPVYDWVEISGIGTPHAFAEDGNMTFPLGFTFGFFGTGYTSVNVSANGWLSFTSTTYGYVNRPIPEATQPNALIAVLWDDLSPPQAEVPEVPWTEPGIIYTWADPTGQRFIVQWEGIPYFGTWYNLLTFQAILNADGTILCQYKTVYDRGSATYGLENADASDYLAVAYNSPYAHSGMALKYSLDPIPVHWLSAAAADSLVQPGQGTELTLTFDASELPEGVYEGHVLMATSDPANPSVVVPLTLTVSATSAVGTEVPERFALAGAVPNPFNPSTRITYAVPAGGADVSLRIYDVSGRLVKELVGGHRPAGYHQVAWQGEDGAGRRVASGLYFYRLEAGGFSQTRKVMLLK
ncbi:MAG: S8 family serine peptidase [Krumholzibacteria bacterium]|nr:S8 family serine peptidase [Candidatus Krumholzibacteria bacterium]